MEYSLVRYGSEKTVGTLGKSRAQDRKTHVRKKVTQHVKRVYTVIPHAEVGARLLGIAVP
ncbi:MAG: hypothetical protein AB7P18_04395 [Candidatus Binatia bacterium]